MKQFKSAGQVQRFLSAHDQINNLFQPPPPRSRHCRRAQSLQDADIPGLGRNLRRSLYDLNRNLRRQVASPCHGKAE